MTQGMKGTWAQRQLWRQMRVRHFVLKIINSSFLPPSNTLAPNPKPTNKNHEETGTRQYTKLYEKSELTHGVNCWVNRVSRSKDHGRGFLTYLSFCRRGGWKGGEGRTKQLNSVPLRLQGLYGSWAPPWLRMRTVFPQPQWSVRTYT